jgi:hypothetical protein
MTHDTCEVCRTFGHTAIATIQLYGRWLCQGHYDLACKVNSDAGRLLARYYTHRGGETMPLSLMTAFYDDAAEADQDNLL